MLLAIIRQALATMGQHRRWAALTMFGIIWGTASIVLLVGWGVGVQGMVEVGLQKVGKNLVFVIPGRVGEDLSPAEERRVLTFDLDDVKAVRAATRYGELVGAEVELWKYVRNGSRGRVADVRGIDPTIQQLRATTVAVGAVDHAGRHPFLAPRRDHRSESARAAARATTRPRRAAQRRRHELRSRRPHVAPRHAAQPLPQRHRRADLDPDHGGDDVEGQQGDRHDHHAAARAALQQRPQAGDAPHPGAAAARFAERRGGRLHHQHGRHPLRLRFRLHRAEGLPRRAGDRHAADRRHRGDEHDAGLGQRAAARDRAAPGGRGASARRRGPVPRRDARHHACSAARSVLSVGLLGCARCSASCRATSFRFPSSCRPSSFSRSWSRPSSASPPDWRRPGARRSSIRRNRCDRSSGSVARELRRGDPQRPHALAARRPHRIGHRLGHRALRVAQRRRHGGASSLSREDGGDRAQGRLRLRRLDPEERAAPAATRAASISSTTIRRGCRPRRSSSEPSPRPGSARGAQGRRPHQGRVDHGRRRADRRHPQLRRRIAAASSRRSTSPATAAFSSSAPRSRSVSSAAARRSGRRSSSKAIRFASSACRCRRASRWSTWDRATTSRCCCRIRPGSVCSAVRSVSTG